MILKYSNDAFDFEPLVDKTEELLFENRALKDYILQKLASGFDEIYVIMAALFAVCRQNSLDEFVNDLNLFLSYAGIQLDISKID